MTEIWKDVTGAEGLYQVSSIGRVRSLDRDSPRANRWGGMSSYRVKGRIIKLNPDKDGYLNFSLWVGGISSTCAVHRLVAQAFVPNPLGKPQVNHRDGDKTNNHVSNLEWVTNSENQKHSYELLGKALSVPLPRKRPVVAEKEGGEGIWFPSIVDAEKHGANRNAIYMCLTGMRKHHHGMRWSYV